MRDGNERLSSGLRPVAFGAFSFASRRKKKEKKALPCQVSCRPLSVAFVSERRYRVVTDGLSAPVHTSYLPPTCASFKPFPNATGDEPFRLSRLRLERHDTVCSPLFPSTSYSLKRRGSLAIEPRVGGEFMHSLGTEFKTAPRYTYRLKTRFVSCPKLSMRSSGRRTIEPCTQFTHPPLFRGYRLFAVNRSKFSRRKYISYHTGN